LKRRAKMQKSIKKIPIQDLLASMLKDSINAAQTAGAFYRYIGEQIKNGLTRSKFIKFSDEESKKHKDVLNERLKLEEKGSCISGSEGADSCKDTSSYSLIGALHLAKESVRKIIRICKKERKEDRDHHEIYDAIIKDEKRYYKALKKEEDFPRPE